MPVVFASSRTREGEPNRQPKCLDGEGPFELGVSSAMRVTFQVAELVPDHQDSATPKSALSHESPDLLLPTILVSLSGARGVFLQDGQRHPEGAAHKRF